VYRIILFFLAIIIAGVPRDARAVVQQDEPVTGSCVNCHRVMGDARLSDPVTDYADDVHSELGFGCSSCHGGDPTVTGMSSMDTTIGFLGTPDRLEILSVCGRCHSDPGFMRQYNPSARVDQVAQYRTSIHGIRLLEHADTNVAICSSCHQTHSIRSPSNPFSKVAAINVPGTCGECHSSAERMESYDIPIDQLSEYQTSVHWRNLSEGGDRGAPVCNDCHGNHGAAPPGVAWVGNVCGQCHGVIAEYFADSRHAEIFPLMGRPGCPACHDNHAIVEMSDELLGLGDGSLCRNCHSPGTGSGDLVEAMGSLIDSLRIGVEEATEILERAETAGMEVSQAQVDLSFAHTALLNSRAAFHSLDVASVDAKVTAGLEISDSAFASGIAALGELHQRKMWLGALVPLILLMIIGMIIKIRQLESPEPTNTQNS
jgi:hypothetical protein